MESIEEKVIPVIGPEDELLRSCERGSRGEVE